MAMDNSIFKSLTCGVTFKRPKHKREPPKKEKIEEIKIESDDEEFTAVEVPAKKRKKLSQEFLRQKQLEDTHRIRKQHSINVKGSVEKVKPIETFDELFQRYPLHHQLVANIKSFKYTEPTPVQMQILPLFLEKKALKVVAPTGSGKFNFSQSLSSITKFVFLYFRKNICVRCAAYPKLVRREKVVA